MCFLRGNAHSFLMNTCTQHPASTGSRPWPTIASHWLRTRFRSIIMIDTYALTTYISIPNVAPYHANMANLFSFPIVFNIVWVCLPFPGLPDTAILIQRHTRRTNAFGCVWFRQILRFPHGRDQMSFGYSVNLSGIQEVTNVFHKCGYVLAAREIGHRRRTGLVGWCELHLIMEII